METTILSRSGDIWVLDRMKYHNSYIKVESSDEISILPQAEVLFSYRMGYQILPETINTDMMKMIEVYGIRCINIPHFVLTNNRVQNDYCGVLVRCKDFDLDDYAYNSVENLSVQSNRIVLHQKEIDFKHMHKSTHIESMNVMLEDETYNEWVNKYAGVDVIEPLHPQYIIVYKNPTGYKAICRRGAIEVENVHQCVLRHPECQCTVLFNHYRSQKVMMISRTPEYFSKVLLRDPRGWIFGEVKPEHGEIHKTHSKGLVYEL